MVETPIHTIEDELEVAKLRAENATLQGVVTSYALTERELKSERDKLRAALERAEKLFDAIAMRDQNGNALDGANEIRAALANEQEGYVKPDDPRMTTIIKGRKPLANEQEGK